jgi:hypothetical protein
MLTDRNAAIAAKDVPAALKISAASLSRFHCSGSLEVDV